MRAGDGKREVGDDDPTDLLRVPSDEELRTAVYEGAAQTVRGPTTGARGEMTEAFVDPRAAREPSRTVVTGAPRRRAEATAELPEGAEEVTLRGRAVQEETLALDGSPERTTRAALSDAATLRMREETLALSGSVPLREETLALSGPSPVRAGAGPVRVGSAPPRTLHRLRSSMQGTLIWINVVCGVLIVIGAIVLLLR